VEVNRFDLFDHHKPGNVLTIWNRHVKWVVAPRIGNGTGDAETSVFIEQVIAYYQRGPSPSLHVP